MSTWLIEADFGTGYEDITAHCAGGIERRQKLHKGLKPAISTASFKVVDITTANKFNTTSADIPCKITKDGSLWFKGLVRKKYRNNIKSTLRDFEVEIVDKGIELKKKIDESFAYGGYKLSDPNNKSNSLLHQIFYKAGFEDAELNFFAIDKTIDFFVVERVEKKRYDEEIQKLLFEYGYVYYFDESGICNLYDLFPTSITAPTITDADLYEYLNFSKVEHQYEAVRVVYYEHVTKNDILVFVDTSGGDQTNKCNITLAAGEYYPANSDQHATYCTYKVDDYDVLIVQNATLEITQTGVTTQIFTPLFKRAQLKLYSSGGGTITKLDIRGDATLIDKNNEIRVLQYVVTDSDKIEDIKTEYIGAKTDADRLANGIADYYRYSDFMYEFKGEGYEIGEYYTLSDDIMSLNTKIRIVEVVEDEWGEQRIKAEGIDEYTITATEEESDYSPPTVPPEEQGETTPTLYLTHEEDQEGYNAAGGTTTPTVPTVQAESFFRTIALFWDRQENLTNFDHYEIQVSDDESTWYALKFDGTDWKGGAGAVTSVTGEYLQHTNIPPAGTEADPQGRLLYYRVRRVTKEPLNSNWSTTVNATTSHIQVKDIEVNAVTNIKIIDNAITTTKITDDAVTTAKIAANAVTANEIAANTITSNEIAANTITAAEIAANTITANEIAANTITANEIAANTITAAEIAADTITAAEIATGVLNALIAEIRQYIEISDTVGFLGKTYTGTPVSGDERTYLDKDEIKIQEYDGSVWNTKIQLGGDLGPGRAYFADNVGIGTTNPISKLQIASTSSEGLILTSTSGDSNTNGAKIVFRGCVGEVGGQGAEIRAINETTYGRKGLAFFTSNTASDTYTPVERVRIDRFGNVGIGTTSPTAKLTLSGGMAMASHPRTYGTTTAHPWVIPAGQWYITSVTGYDTPLRIYGGVDWNILGHLSENQPVCNLRPAFVISDGTNYRIDNSDGATIRYMKIT